VRAIVPTWITATPAPAKVFRDSQGLIQKFLAPLLDTAENSDWLVAGAVGEFSADRTRFHIPRFIFMGPPGGGDTVRLGIFAGLHGDDYAGPEAVLTFLQQLESRPDLAKGYHIFAYPFCNPSGFDGYLANVATVKRVDVGEAISEFFECERAFDQGCRWEAGAAVRYPLMRRTDDLDPVKIKQPN
jgi:hypothetical protein